MTLILVGEQLLSDNGIALSPSHHLRVAISKHKARIRAEFVRAKLAHPTTAVGEADAALPRWIRVNGLLSNMQEVTEYLQRSYTITTSQPISDVQFFIDPLIPNLLALHISQTSFLTKSPLYKTGKIILQDKASCFSAILLDPNPEETVIDACAAPGNKTTHLAALMHGKGSIIAVERDAMRSATLQRMVATAAAQNIVQIVHADFLQLNPCDEKFRQVTKILLDPSCSGSGLPSHQSSIGDVRQETDFADATRLQDLSAFQCRMFQHALKFPSVRRVVYSTCSENAIENEQVLMEVLKSNADWQYYARSCQTLKDWPTRGLITECDNETEIADSCIRSYHKSTEGTIGFFAACLVRKN